MNASTMIRIASAALALLFAAAPVAHAVQSSANFAVKRDVLANGGVSSASANFKAGSTVGQGAIGTLSSANFKTYAGFWGQPSFVFTLVAQIGVPISTPITSNTITVNNILTAAAISIVGGSYSINGGAYVTTAGTVNSGDTVTVRQVSSASYTTTTLATLTIAGVSRDFSVTTSAPPPGVLTVTGPNAGGGGTITGVLTPGPGQPITCGFAVASQFIPLTGGAGSPPAGTAPAGFIFPFGLFNFSLTGCAAGGSGTLTITYPQAIPAGSSYWKYGPTAAKPAPHWYTIPALLSGNKATFTLVDGGLGDDDLTANGTIVDPGGPAFGPGGAAPVPTLPEWALLLLAALTGGLGLRAIRRREQRR